LTISIRVLNATGKLDNYIGCLESEIEGSIAKIREYFELEKIDITVSPFQQGEESPSGVGGYALSSHRIELLIDCTRDDIKEVIEAELLEVLSHEVHHALRMRFNMPSVTLGQQLIMEGLACHFEHTITGGKISSLFRDLQNYDWQESLVKMNSSLNDSEFQFNRFFLGSHPDEFPKYAGYWVGFNIISQYIQDYKVTDTALVGLGSEVFFDAGN